MTFRKAWKAKKIQEKERSRPKTQNKGEKSTSSIIETNGSKSSFCHYRWRSSLLNYLMKKQRESILNLVAVQAETAADLFELMKTDLAKHDVQITQLVGFTAETTKVIFAENNSVASRINEENPNCLAIK